MIEDVPNPTLQTVLSEETVSTVCLDQSQQTGHVVIDDVPQSLLFETMVFGGKFDGAQRRCSTWEQAQAQHEAMVSEMSAER